MISHTKEGGFLVSERITFKETKDTRSPGSKSYWLLMHLWKDAHLVKAKIMWIGEKRTPISMVLHITFTFHLLK